MRRAGSESSLPSEGAMLLLYDYLESGNGYKVRLLLTQLGTPFTRKECDILKGETRTADFIRVNPNGKIPALVFPDGRTLWESNAILWHLAQDTAFLPSEPFEQAQVLQWMFFEQYSHEPYIATVRFWTFSGQLKRYQSQLAERRQRGHDALAVMESHLAGREYFVGGRYSIADIALYAYTHVAAEGGYSLEGYPQLRKWLARVAEQPRHLQITDLCGANKT